MKYHIITFGCQLNRSDSERIAAFFEKLGYSYTFKKENADILIINACSIRQSAIDRIWGMMKNFKKLKCRTLLTGCLLERDLKKFKEHFDYILSIKSLPQWKRFLKKRKCFYYPNPRKAEKTDYLKIEPKYQTTFRTLVPIMSGCDNFCSYCVVPYVRGKEISRPEKEIIKQIKNAVKDKAKEIWLLGENVNSYSSIPFPKLLRKISEIPGDFWIYFTSPHPKDFSDNLIEVINSCDKVAKYVNLPIQSGDNIVLKKMNRPYTVSFYQKIIKKIRKKMPDITLSTDIIVGFPGETREQFKNTIKLFKKIGFDMAYISQYSPRPETSAFLMEDNVSHQEKEKRERELTKILKQTAIRNNKKYVNKTIRVLCEKRKDNYIIGKTQTYKTVKFESDRNLIGEFADVKITEALPWGLKGEIKDKKIIVILGPTSSGKSETAVKLAKKINGEIVSADSRQVYKGMDIGTGKITKKEMQNIPHYLLDVVSPKKRFDVVQYRELALKAINEIFKKDKTPIICGGTGFYIQALIDGLIIPEVKPDWNLRKKLEKETAEKLFKKLKKLDPKRAKTIDKKNKRRIIRALEIVIKTKKPVPLLKKEPISCPVLIFGIKNDNLEKLIEKRLLKRLKQGMVKEVKNLKRSGISWKRLEEFGLEYRWIARYLQNKIEYKDMVEELQKDIQSFSKRQMTWFKRNKCIHWIEKQEILKAEGGISQ